MLGSKPISTSLVLGTSLTVIDGIVPVNANMYCQVIDSLQHLQMTRPDISFAMNKFSKFMHVQSEQHWGAVKRLLGYLSGTRSIGIWLLGDTPKTLHDFFHAN